MLLVVPHLEKSTVLYDILTAQKWNRLSGRSNVGIHQTIELIQHSKTGVMEEESAVEAPDSATKKFDIFTGDSSGNLPLAKIHSLASTSAAQQEKKSGFWGRGRKVEHRKSAIEEAG